MSVISEIREELIFSACKVFIFRSLGKDMWAKTVQCWTYRNLCLIYKATFLLFKHEIWTSSKNESKTLRRCWIVCAGWCMVQLVNSSAEATWVASFSAGCFRSMLLPVCWQGKNKWVWRMNYTPQVTKQNGSVEKNRMPNTYSRYCLTNKILMIPHFFQKTCMIFYLQPSWVLCLANVLTKQEKHSMCKWSFWLQCWF